MVLPLFKNTRFAAASWTVLKLTFEKRIVSITKTKRNLCRNTILLYLIRKENLHEICKGKGSFLVKTGRYYANCREAKPYDLFDESVGYYFKISPINVESFGNNVKIGNRAPLKWPLIVINDSKLYIMSLQIKLIFGFKWLVSELKDTYKQIRRGFDMIDVD